MGGAAGKRISAAHPPCKSGLVLLCERFTQRFGQLTADGKPSCLPLNEVATALEVPRRRLYDILNVLEAVEVRANSWTYVRTRSACQHHICVDYCRLMPLHLSTMPCLACSVNAAQVVQRACKLTYRWQGTGHIGKLASRLAEDELQGAHQPRSFTPHPLCNVSAM